MQIMQMMREGILTLILPFPLSKVSQLRKGTDATELVP